MQDAKYKSRGDEPTNPSQFQVIDLIAMVSIAALVAAMGAPMLRWAGSVDRMQILVVMCVQLVCTAGAITLAIFARRRVLARGGMRLGIGYVGAIRWRHWPVVKSAICMAFFAVAQLALAAAILRGVRPFIAFMGQLQIGLAAGLALARFTWRVYPGAIEFFESGVSLYGVTFFPWPQVTLRPSQVFPDRMVLIIRPSADSPSAETRMVQFPATLWGQVSQVANRSVSPSSSAS